MLMVMQKGTSSLLVAVLIRKGVNARINAVIIRRNHAITTPPSRGYPYTHERDM